MLAIGRGRLSEASAAHKVTTLQRYQLKATSHVNMITPHNQYTRRDITDNTKVKVKSNVCYITQVVLYCCFCSCVVPGVMCIWNGNQFGTWDLSWHLAHTPSSTLALFEVGNINNHFRLLSPHLCPERRERNSEGWWGVGTVHTHTHAHRLKHTHTYTPLHPQTLPSTLSWMHFCTHPPTYTHHTPHTPTHTYSGLAAIFLISFKILSFDLFSTSRVTFCPSPGG